MDTMKGLAVSLVLVFLSLITACAHTSSSRSPDTDTRATRNNRQPLDSIDANWLREITAKSQRPQGNCEPGSVPAVFNGSQDWHSNGERAPTFMTVADSCPSPVQVCLKRCDSTFSWQLSWCQAMFPTDTDALVNCVARSQVIYRECKTACWAGTGF
jgi:hypothetical protein